MIRIMPVMIAAALTFNISANTASPYAGEEHREIKSLSPETIESYLNGAGLGYARAAELNRYPGPMHVLDLAEELALTQEQESKTKEIFYTMRTDVVGYGEQLVQKETDLDTRFLDGTIDHQSLAQLVRDIGIIEAKIRYSHLNAHLEQIKILSKYQINRYNQLRGYDEPDKRNKHKRH